MKFPPVARCKTPAEFAARLAELAAPGEEAVGCDERVLTAPESPLAAPAEFAGRRVGNRFCIHPMEGWDGTRDGAPSDLTLRRWRNFGLSGAKLIWGGEAFAVLPEARANPNQLFRSPASASALARLLDALRSAHRERFGADATDDLVVGLQLTHSGRFCRPNASGVAEPRVAHSHPALDARFGVDPAKALLTDGELDGIAEAFVAAAKTAREVGFDFVDVKHCHGYLLHEILAAKTRPGRYGGSFENRTRPLREIVAGIRRDAPGLAVGVRLSIYDDPPAPPEGAAWPAGTGAADFHFGTDAADPSRTDLAEPLAFLALCRELGVAAINVTTGSPYYSPHIQRPAAYPPVDGAPNRDDPLRAVVRLIATTRELKRLAPETPTVGTGYTYLQEYMPHVAQAAVRTGAVDFVGLGRLVLSYPDAPADILEKGEMARGKVCRTFSDCTNGPRMGFVSGCFPLDPEYRNRPEWEAIRERKKAAGSA